MQHSNMVIALGLIAAVFGFILLQHFVRRASSTPRVALDETPLENAVIIDGSNVMHWKTGTPDLASVRLVIEALISKGFSPGVVFDANAGYLLTGKYQHDKSLSRALGLPENRVMVVPKGTPADPQILAAARDMQARIVTNDRFRDWAGDYPEIRNPGHLIRGDIKNGRVELQLSPRKRRKKGNRKSNGESGTT